MSTQSPPPKDVAAEDSGQPVDSAAAGPAASDTAAPGTGASGTEATDAARPSGRRRESFAAAVRGDSPTLMTVLAIVLAGVVGAVLIVVSDPPTKAAAGYFFADPIATFKAAALAIGHGYAALFEGAVFDPATLSQGGLAVLGPISETLVNATPLILAGLAVTVAFRAGLFNIGAQGQILLGAIFAGYVGFAWQLPIVLHLLVALVAGILGGVLWGGIAGWLKARTGAHEVITTIMLNYIAISLIGYLLGLHGFQAPPYGQAISRVVEPSAQLPHLLGSDLRVNAGVFLAVLATAGVWWLLNRSTLGFSLRAVGANHFAARTAGMNIGRSYLVVMVIAGGLAGLAGATQILGINNQVTSDIDSGIGFDAITVALLGRGNAWGTFWAGLLFGALRAGGVQMLAVTPTPVELVQIVQSLIVLFIAAPGLIRVVFRIRARQQGVGAELAKGWNG